MAYLSEINLKCYGLYGHCPKPARVILKNHRNEEINQFCRRCGQQELRTLKEKEGQIR